MPDSSTRARVALLTCCLLALVTLAVYWPVVHCEFVVYDDADYVTQNPHVRTGLTWQNVGWAITAERRSNWHPLTWISHMVDCELYGSRPAGHHATNLLFHIANSILVFLVLRRMTGAQWRSAFVAALFALHPLHVESVAWVSERKDVLSTLFGLLTLLAYVRFVRKPEVQSPKSKVQSPNSQLATHNSQLITHNSQLRPLASGSYWLVVVLFALGLMAKPMLVTLPFLLLLLDFWPLGRVPGFGFRVSSSESATVLAPASGDSKPETRNSKLSPSTPQSSTVVWRLILEKVPLLALSIVSSAITLSAQARTENIFGFSLSYRLANAVVSYSRYVGKMVWPDALVVLYPFPKAWATWQVAGAVLAVLGASVLAFWQARRRPYAFTGWFWYLGTLVPVIGLVQVGAQSMADRYTYVPLIGLFMIIAWGGYELAARLQLRRFALAAIAALPLAACVPLTRMQLAYWQDSLTLFDHAVRCTTGNSMMENNLGAALTERGELDAAREHLSKAVKILPSEAKAHLNLGIVLSRQGKSAEAIRSYRFALAYRPDMSAAHFRLAVELVKQRELAEATENIADALRLGISRREVYTILGLPLPKPGPPAAESGPLPHQPTLNSTNAEILSCAAMALDRLGRVRDAVAEYREALRYDPQMLSALNNLAWILASDPNPDVRDGKESVRLAEAACRFDGYKDATLVSTLGVAYAEDGRFAEAVEMANRAEAMARAAGNIALAEKNRQRGELFRSRQSYHEPPVFIIATPARSYP